MPSESLNRCEATFAGLPQLKAREAVAVTARKGRVSWDHAEHLGNVHCVYSQAVIQEANVLFGFNSSKALLFEDSKTLKCLKSSHRKRSGSGILSQFSKACILKCWPN